MKETTMSGQVCSIPYHRSTARGEVTQFCMRTNADVLSIIFWGYLGAEYGEEVTAVGSMRERLFWSDDGPQMVVEFVAESIIKPTEKPTNRRKTG